MPPFSVLDLAPVPEGFTPSDALRNTLDLAQQLVAWPEERGHEVVTRDAYLH